MSKQLYNIIKSLELELLKPEVRGNAKRLDELLDDKFIEIGRAGKKYNKQDIIDLLTGSAKKASIGRVWKVTEFELVPLTSVLVMAMYRYDESHGRYKTRTLRSSIWKKEKGKWKMFFHQGTRSVH